MKKKKLSLKKLSLNKKVVSNLEGQQTNGGVFVTQVCPIVTLACPGTWICPVETRFCPRETWICPIDTKFCPTDSFVCPTDGTVACPY